MIVIISGVLGESELSYFNVDTYNAFNKLINKKIAMCLSRYWENKNADQETVRISKEQLGSTVSGIMNNELLNTTEVQNLIQAMTTIDLQNDFSDLKDLNTKLSKLDDMLNSCTTYIQPRTKEDFDEFIHEYKLILNLMEEDGVPTTYPNILDYVKDNSAVLYQPFEKITQLPSANVKRLRDSWYSVKKGIDWITYCRDNNISNREAII